MESEKCVTKTWVHRFREIETRKLTLSVTQNPGNNREKIDRPGHIRNFKFYLAIEQQNSRTGKIFTQLVRNDWLCLLTFQKFFAVKNVNGRFTGKELKVQGKPTKKMFDFICLF